MYVYTCPDRVAIAFAPFFKPLLTLGDTPCNNSSISEKVTFLLAQEGQIIRLFLLVKIAFLQNK
jgi:hypothetical protein